MSDTITINKWKTFALIFLVLLILETAFVVWMFQIGSEELEKEDICSWDICGDDKYDSIQIAGNTCYCYTDGVVTHQEDFG